MCNAFVRGRCVQRYLFVLYRFSTERTVTLTGYRETLDCMWSICLTLARPLECWITLASHWLISWNTIVMSQQTNSISWLTGESGDHWGGILGQGCRGRKWWLWDLMTGCRDRKWWLWDLMTGLKEVKMKSCHLSFKVACISICIGCIYSC